MASLKILAQNVDIHDGHPHARTGEISVPHLVSAGAQGVILGHSEAGDTPDTVRSKLRAAIASPLKHIVLLVGESWEEFEGNSPAQVAGIVRERCAAITHDLTLPEGIILGYEPKWGTFGSGKEGVPPPNPEYIAAAVRELRAFAPRVIYGGRSDPTRTREIIARSNVDGFILGSACSSVQKTLAIASEMRGAPAKILICNFKAYELADPYDLYVEALEKLPDDFLVFLAPPYTDIRFVRDLVKK
jgi:triosephosphate isomerase